MGGNITSPIATSPARIGFSIEPLSDMYGNTRWKWHAWYRDAEMKNAAKTYEDATWAVERAHEQMVGDNVGGP